MLARRLHRLRRDPEAVAAVLAALPGPFAVPVIRWLMAGLSAAAIAAGLATAGTGFVRTRACARNLRQLGVALTAYVADYDGHYPPTVDARFVGHRARSSRNWLALLAPYRAQGGSAACPARELPGRLMGNSHRTQTAGYAYNVRLTTAMEKPSGGRDRGKHEASVRYPSLTVRVFDSRACVQARAGPDIGTRTDDIGGLLAGDFMPEILAQTEGARRHRGGANYGFADGHVDWFRPDDLAVGPRCDGQRPGFGL